MPSIKNLEMAAALSNDERIVIKKSLFSQKAVYQPTQSAIDVDIKEYAPEQGARLERLLALPVEKLAAELQAKGVPASTPVGQYRLELCRSKDGLFAAVQLYRFADFNYHKASELIICEGDKVAALEPLF